MITVIIPVLNEEKIIPQSLLALENAGDYELIVVDGGSEDMTVPVAREFTDKVFVTKRGRGCQMNFGAERASGDVLLFLHVDCRLPENGFTLIRDVISDEGVSAGAFDLSIDHPALRYRIMEAGANLRSRLTSIPYGDQGMFMRRDVFERLGGFSDIPIMEDVELSLRLKNLGKIAFIRPPIKTSPRRWQKEGPVYTTIRDWTLAISYSLFGVSPQRLVKYYQSIR
jgi:rSAM/selenodomain-associated transferase 2